MSPTGTPANESSIALAPSPVTHTLTHGGGGGMVCRTTHRKRLKASPTLEFGNSVYRIRFDTKDHFPTYGARYHFYLEDAVDSPEYLVHIPTLQKYANERHEMELVVSVCVSF